MTFPPHIPNDAGQEDPPARRLRVFNGGFLWTRDAARIRRILSLAGWHVGAGAVREGDAIAKWGNAGTAHRATAAAARTGAPLVHVEDGFVRSLFPGRSGGAPPLGLLVDERGLHFDPGQHQPRDPGPKTQSRRPDTTTKVQYTIAGNSRDRRSKQHRINASTIPVLRLQKVQLAAKEGVARQLLSHSPTGCHCLSERA